MQAVELLAQGADPTTRDKAGVRPLHYAAAHGHMDMVAFLASKGVDTDVEDPHGRTPLHHAAAGRWGKRGGGGGTAHGCTVSM
jgi:cytohesin